MEIALAHVLESAEQLFELYSKLGKGRNPAD
jgi:hypothetical protein